MAQIARSETSLADAAGSSADGALALDTFDRASSIWHLETIFVHDTLQVLEGTPSSSAHRIRVEVRFVADGPGAGLHGPLHITVERKWAVEPFSLFVGSTVRDSGGRSVSSGVDLDTIASAVAVPCFVKGWAPAGSSSGVDEHSLTLPAGVELRTGQRWLEVACKGCGSAERVVRRDFPESLEGVDCSKRVVQVKGSG